MDDPTIIDLDGEEITKGTIPFDVSDVFQGEVMDAFTAITLLQRDFSDMQDVQLLLVEKEHAKWQELYMFLLYVFSMLAVVEGFTLFATLTSVWTTTTDCFLVGVRCGIYIWASYVAYSHCDKETLGFAAKEVEEG